MCSSDLAQKLIALLKEKQIVVDPTAGWGEMAGHPKTIDAASFEPGLNAARAMRLDRESGTIQPGKRADLVLIDGNPLTNISDIRRVSKVITEGRMYDSKELGHAVGFNR